MPRPTVPRSVVPRATVLTAWLLLPLTVPASAQGPPPARRVADLTPGSERTEVSPTDAVLFDGRIFFSGQDPSVGRELWATDGTREGQRLIADLVPGPASSYARQLTVVGERLFFEACGPTRGCELWTSNGDPSETRVLTDVQRGPDDSGGLPVVQGLSAWKDLAVFLQDDGERGYEPWVSDGTSAGTVLLAELVPGRGPVSPEEAPELRVAGSTLFVLPQGDGELWAARAPGQAPELLVDFGSGARIRESMTVGDRLLLSVQKGRHELWVSDGTADGTRAVPALVDAGGWMTPVGTANGLAYLWFTQSRLWASDGTVGGTRRVTPPSFYAPSPSFRPYTPLPTATFDDSLYFVSNRLLGLGVGPSYLWRVHGDDSVERVYMWPFHQIADMAATPDALYMVQRYVTTPEIADLVVSDGGGDPPRRLLRDLAEISGLVVRGNELFFRAPDGKFDELWRTDGTPKGTVPVTSARQPRDSAPSHLTAHGDQVAFTLRNGRLGFSDGTKEGTRLLDESGGGLRRAGERTYVFTPGLRVLDEDGGLRQVFSRGHVRAQKAVELGGRLYFLAWSFDTYAYELRSSDGTEEGTYRVRELIRIPSVEPVEIVAAGDRLFASVGPDLWESDGSREDDTPPEEEAPNFSTFDLCPDCFPVFREVAAVGDRLFFVLQYYRTQYLWTSDGTVEGSLQLTSAAEIRSLTTAGGRLFFVATDELGDELWASDGTPEGTSRRLDILPGPRSSLPAELTAVQTAAGEKLFFSADDGVHGRELWTSDGAAEGTRLVADLWPGEDGGEPSELQAAGGRLYFSAQDGVHGFEPWTSDGTANGTRLVYDAYRGLRSSEPYGFVRAGDLVFFAARDGAGVELWAADAAAIE